MNTSLICFTEDSSGDGITEEAWILNPDNPTQESSLATSIILLAFVIIGLPWNSIILIRLCRDKFYKEPSSFLLFNLVLVDLLTCLLVMPFQTAPGLAGGRYTLGQSDYQLCLTCYAGVMTIICLLYVSIHLLAVMSVDRLVYIVRPLHYDKIVTVPRTVAAILVIWILCIILSTPPSFQFGVIAFSQNLGTCSLLLSSEMSIHPPYYYMLFLILEVTFPLVVLFTANIWLLLVLRKTFKKRLKMDQVSVSVQSSSSREHNQRVKSVYNKRQLRMVKMFASIFISNIATWLPIIAALVVIGIGSSSNTPPGIYSMVFLCFLSQSIIHPIVESCLIGSISITCMKRYANRLFKKT